MRKVKKLLTNYLIKVPQGVWVSSSLIETPKGGLYVASIYFVYLFVCTYSYYINPILMIYDYYILRYFKNVQYKRSYK